MLLHPDANTLSSNCKITVLLGFYCTDLNYTNGIILPIRLPM